MLQCSRSKIYSWLFLRYLFRNCHRVGTSHKKVHLNLMDPPLSILHRFPTRLFPFTYSRIATDGSREQLTALVSAYLDEAFHCSCVRARERHIREPGRLITALIIETSDLLLTSIQVWTSAELLLRSILLPGR